MRAPGAFVVVMDTEEPMQPSPALDGRIQRHHAELVGFLARRSPEDAEGLAQEVWLRVARANPDCPTETQFRAYTYAVARRLLIDHHRRRAARIQIVSLEGGLDVAGGQDPDSPHGAVSTAQMLTAVERALSSMKPELAEVFRWRTGDDVPFKEIAARQGVNLNTALGRMHQATRKIAAVLHALDLLSPGDPP